jgi:NhaP-type Na+/H+ and K+/H+ antiporter
MDSSRNEKIYRRNNKASRILQMVLYFLVIFSVICPTDEVLIYLTMVCLIIAFIFLILPFCVGYLKKEE